MSSTKISKDYQDGYDLGYKKGYVDGAKDFQPKKGKWIKRGYIGCDTQFYWCSVCEYERSYDAETGPDDYNFCPNCGADMRSAQNLSYADNDTAQGGLASAT